MSFVDCGASCRACEGRFEAEAEEVETDWEQQALQPGQTFTEIGMVLLGVTADDNLPFMTYPWCTTWTELLKASKMRYDALGRSWRQLR